MKASPETACAIVQRQLDAYNARDLDAFLDCFSSKVEVYQFPDALRYRGKGQLRNDYRALFGRASNLECEVLHRTVLGNRVTDHQTVTGVFERTIECLTIYEVEDEQIRRTWFMF